MVRLPSVLSRLLLPIGRGVAMTASEPRESRACPLNANEI
jgi:hypothetical protein